MVPGIIKGNWPMPKKRKVESPSNDPKAVIKVPDPTNIVELQDLEEQELSAQELLTLLSRRTDIEDLLIIIPVTTEVNGELVQDLEIITAGDLSNAHINWLADKVKLHILGVDV